MTSTTLRLSETGRAIGLREAGSGAPVVLIHGVGMQSAAWAPQIEALSLTHHVIALDMPGHGSSAPLPQGSQLPAYVAWLREALTGITSAPVSLVGHSMGALIAAGFAVSHPGQVARVALLNGVYRRSAEARAAVRQRAAEIAAGHHDIDTPLKRWFGDTPAEQKARAAVARWLRAVELEGYANAYTAFATGDATYADRFAEISCPFLALTGAQDPNSTPRMAQAMAEAVQDGQAVVIDGHRHMVNLTAPDVVTGHLNAWLSRTAKTREALR
ncbi:alpha/beta fold hydrolase [Primorskyibacter sp. S187A]|uniref:alpha/beta fold hydrolase n=1 Tax=Primorskyibacter sp. S187A TaxID=3415130 RepID=UPI003C7D90EE